MARQRLTDTFYKTLDALTPNKLILNQCRLEGNRLQIQNQTYDLSQYDHIYLFGSGKAVIPMTQAMQKLLTPFSPDTLIVGHTHIVSHTQTSLAALPNTTYLQSTHPLPSEKSLEAGAALKAKMASLKPNDFYIYLLSGGSSAMIEQLVEGVTLADLQQTTQLMLHHGVPIEEMNVVRKALSQIKGGKLAHATSAQGIALVLSDVLGNDLETIGSAPLMHTTKPASGLGILEKYALLEKVPPVVVQALQKANIVPPTHIHHHLLATNETVIETATSLLEQQGIAVRPFPFRIQGDVEAVADKIVQSLPSQKPAQPLCLITGGEATVTVTGNGKGGRNQHLALTLLNRLKHHPLANHLTLLCAATDGIDGNSNAAGAVVDAQLLTQAKTQGFSLQHHLENFNSHTFFQSLNAQILSGATHNNLLDLLIIYIHP